jgi:hypothetical protein
VALDDLELADVAAELLQPLDGPGAEDAVEVAARDAVFAFEDGTVFGASNRPSGDSFTGLPLMA